MTTCNNVDETIYFARNRFLDLVWAGKHEYLVLDKEGRAFYVSSTGKQTALDAVDKANTIAFDWLDQRLFWANDHEVLLYCTLLGCMSLKRCGDRNSFVI